jgi:protein-tyrosine phosphatase
MPNHRRVALAGCCNFRDLGGYPTTDGRRTRWGLLFRSDGLSRLEAADLVVLQTLGIVSVIDLRTDLEVESRGRYSGGLQDARYHHLPLTDVLPGEEEMADWGTTGFVSARYVDMLSQGRGTVAKVMDLLAHDGNQPAVFHCSVGKDRTGVLAAVLLGFLGVPDDVIVTDYTLSAEAMSEVLERLRREYPDSVDVVERYARVITSVDPASMEGFLAGVYRDYGSFAGLARTLEVEAEVERFREHMLIA